MSSSIALIAIALGQFLQIYSVLLIVRILLSWFPNIDLYNPPLSFLSQITDPYLNLFRSIIPPLGGIDFSPILAIFVLNIASRLFVTAAAQAAAYLY
ncbi:YggT family protein [Leptolyngbya sp. 7M]|uniref:YggT family protein n=1 Tax=Leptolyngbya sp. NK1-12 TaxID=2547451 RepID=A0AA96WFR8_9CYAN|nr:YggT family protein [Leptolyngbya sp. 7M]MBF2047588.1 YggT family protein [Elainella sp. C42_A2020_010]QYO65145.1 YggT family protein [Leptolyngbya sp. 7M]RNJ66467.1 MAG: YggT family protein [Leptolyngbya sp. IPPAS B-1204]WNZ21561.1 YggT family protein [Leptolyngbya sp. NK1-12]